MRFRDDDYDWILYDDDDDDDFDDDEDDEDDEDDDDEDDAFDTLEYLHTCQMQSEREIIHDIYRYLKRYQPDFKIVKRKDI